MITPDNSFAPAVTSMMSLNKMFPEYNFLRAMVSGIHRVESFWTFHNPSSSHHKVTIVTYDLGLSELVKQECEFLNTLKKLKHVNVVHLTDAWVVQNKLYIAEELDRASSIRASLNGGRLSVKSTLAVSIQLADALVAMHTHNVCHQGLSPDSISLENAFVKISTPSLYYFLGRLGYWEDIEVNCYQLDGTSHSTERADLYALGGVIFFLHTGLDPDKIDPAKWGEYAIDPALGMIVKELRSIADNHAPSAKSVHHQLTKLETELFPSEQQKDNFLTRLLRIKATKRVTPELLQQEDIVTTKSDQKSDKSEFVKGDRIAERYIIQELVEHEEFDDVYNAVDADLNGKPVLVHALAKSPDLNWKDRFMLIVNQFGGLNHPNINRILDASVSDEGAFFVTERDCGQSLGQLIHKHSYTYPDIVDFSMQILDGLIAAAEKDFVVHTLSADTISTYEKSPGHYHYLMTSVGCAHFLYLTKGRNIAIDRLMKPETLAPELFRKQPCGHRTTQFILGNLVFRCMIGRHPCAGMSLVQAHNYHQSSAFKEVVFSYEGVPTYFKRWLLQLTKSDPNARFPSLELALSSLMKCLK